MLKKFVFRTDDDRALVEVPSDIFLQAMEEKGVSIEVKENKALFICPFCQASKTKILVTATYEPPSEAHVFGRYVCPVCGEKSPEEVSDFLGLSVEQLGAKSMLILNRSELAIQNAIEKILDNTNLVFLRNGEIVVVCFSNDKKNAVLRVATASELKMRIGEEVRCLRYDARTKAMARSTLSDKTIKDTMERFSHVHLRPIVRIVEQPLIGNDGNATVLTAGYDDKTCCYFSFNPQEFSSLKDTVTKEEAEKAYQLLRKEVLGDFSFVDKVDEAAAVLLLVTAVIVASLKTTPMFLITSKDFGVGKTTLCQIAAIFSSTSIPRVITARRDGDEFTREIMSALASPTDVFILENLIGNVPLNPTLCTVLTGMPVSARAVGSSRMISTQQSKILMMATGAKVVPQEDMVRRTLPIQIERPTWTYEKRNILEYVRKNRSLFITEALKIVKWGRQNKVTTKRPIPSFEDWDCYCRAAICELIGVDPVSRLIGNIEFLSSQEHKKPAAEVVLETLLSNFGGDIFTTKRVIEAIPCFTSKVEVAFEELGLSTSGQVNTRRLGRWLVQSEGFRAGENSEWKLNVKRGKGAVKFRFLKTAG